MPGHRGGVPPVRSKRQQGYIFGVLAKRNPSAQEWGRRWSHMAGESGGRTPQSRAAYARLPEKVGARKAR